MDIDVEFLKRTVAARKDVGKWLMERPYTGLDVTDVELVVQGYDYLARIIKDLTGEDLTNKQEQLTQATIQITLGE